MIVVSNSIPKSGSTLICNYTRDLVNIAFQANGHDELFRRIKAGEIEGTGGGYVKHFGESNVESLIEIHNDFGPYVAKTHCGAQENLRKLIENGIAKVTLIHRDPRDVVLSAFDTGWDGHETIHLSLLKVKEWMLFVQEWIKYGNCLEFRYFDLVTEPQKTLQSLARYLNIEITENQARSIIEKHNLHKNPRYNTGKALRFPDEMNEDQLEYFTKELTNEILTLGYEL